MNVEFHRDIFKFARAFAELFRVVKLKEYSKISLFEVLRYLRGEIGNVWPDSFVDFGKYDFSFYFSILSAHNLHFKSPKSPTQEHSLNRCVIDIVKKGFKVYFYHWKFRKNLLFQFYSLVDILFLIMPC